MVNKGITTDEDMGINNFEHVLCDENVNNN